MKISDYNHAAAALRRRASPEAARAGVAPARQPEEEHAANITPRNAQPERKSANITTSKSQDFITNTQVTEF